MRTVLSLCDFTGQFTAPWVDAGYRANFRSATPRGFARAVFEANARLSALSAPSSNLVRVSDTGGKEQ